MVPVIIPATAITVTIPAATMVAITLPGLTRTTEMIHQIMLEATTVMETVILPVIMN